MRPGIVKCAALLAAVAVVQVGLGGPAWAAKGTTLKESYVGGTNDPCLEGRGLCARGHAGEELTYPGFCRNDNRLPRSSVQNIGRVCFTGLTSSGTYKLEILDVTGQRVGFSYRWMPGAWNSSLSGCQRETVTRPRAAVGLEVFLDGPDGPFHCLEGNPPRDPGPQSTLGLATSGEVVLTKPPTHRRG